MGLHAVEEAPVTILDAEETDSVQSRVISSILVRLDL